MAVEENSSNGISSRSRHIVIVGAGIAGLTCAKELLSSPKKQAEGTQGSSINTVNENIRVTLVEAADRVGGRLYCPSDKAWAGDLGAQQIHGMDTIVTRAFDELREAGAWEGYSKPSETNGEDDDFYREFYITSHADGGPENPTKEGKIGLYYVSGKLLMYNDPEIMVLSSTIEDVLSAAASRHINGTTCTTKHPPVDKASDDDIDVDDNPSEISVGQALRNHNPPLPPHLYSLAVGSFGNAAGTTNLDDLSMLMLQWFEDRHQHQETAGDYQPPISIGMHGLADMMLKKQLLVHDNFSLQLNWKVRSIRQENDNVAIVSDKGDCLEMVDAVVLTVPPPILTQLGMELPSNKMEALEFVGYEPAVKVCLKFKRRLWPEPVQGIVCADDCLIPEMWFGVCNYAKDDCRVYYRASAFFFSTKATAFLKKVKVTAYTGNGKKPSSLDDAAAEVVLAELSEILQIPLFGLQESLVDSVLKNWYEDPFIQGGYMHPKVGMTPSHLQALAAPVGRVFFAGEATNTNACCTVQAAMETGVRAAKEVMESI